MSKSLNVISQNKKILRYLETHKRGITSMDAFTRFGISRISARIFDLRQMGYPIQTIREVKNNADGQTIQYARYVLGE